MGGGWAECDFNALAALGHRLRGENCETLALARRLGCFMPARRASAGVLLFFATETWFAVYRNFQLLSFPRRRQSQSFLHNA